MLIVLNKYSVCSTNSQRFFQTICRYFVTVIIKIKVIKIIMTVSSHNHSSCFIYILNTPFEVLVKVKANAISTELKTHKRYL